MNAFRDWEYQIIDNNTGIVLMTDRGFETESDAEIQAKMDATVENIKNYHIRTHQPPYN